MTSTPTLCRNTAPTVACLALALLVSACASQRHPVSQGPIERTYYREEGVASWYGRAHHGRRTANGERFDMNADTAAHKSLAFGTILRVTNLDNGRTTRVRVNDRGPYVRGRIIDLSARAASELGMRQNGTARVRIERFPQDQPGALQQAQQAR
ncbi:MAG TPA: septal ring lytic transglycosylase RlpA family protein [Alphaproteobacteria bacterium]|jgi:rare lipoprotein A|nr:septal ring lytic transglycosylase RlpA family protein [Alphaproteobacteria bacterium]